jgi:hypothetical protein
MMSHVDD